MPIAEGDAQQAPPEPMRLVHRCLCGWEFDYGKAEDIPGSLEAVAEHVRFDCPKVQRAAPPKWPGAAEKMTLGELEALAERYGKAVSTIKEAQALFAGPASLPPGFVPGSQPQPIAPAAPVSRIPERPPSRIDPEAQAELDAFRLSQERGRLIEQNRDNPANFPPSIANAMRGQ